MTDSLQQPSTDSSQDSAKESDGKRKASVAFSVASVIIGLLLVFALWYITLAPKQITWMPVGYSYFPTFILTLITIGALGVLHQKRFYSSGARVTALGAVTSALLALFLVSGLLFGGALVNSVVDSVEDKVSVQVFLSDNAPQEEVISLQGQIEANAQVKSVSYTSKEQALENFKETMSDNPGVVDGLDGQNPLPASLDVELDDPQMVQTVATEILENPTFLSVAATPDAPAKDLKYGQDIVDRLFTLTNWIRVIGVALIPVFCLPTLVFTVVTVVLETSRQRKLQQV